MRDGNIWPINFSTKGMTVVSLPMRDGNPGPYLVPANSVTLLAYL